MVSRVYTHVTCHPCTPKYVHLCVTYISMDWKVKTRVILKDGRSQGDLAWTYPPIASPEASRNHSRCPVSPSWPESPPSVDRCFLRTHVVTGGVESKGRPLFSSHGTSGITVAAAWPKPSGVASGRGSGRDAVAPLLRDRGAGRTQDISKRPRWRVSPSPSLFSG